MNECRLTYWRKPVFVYLICNRTGVLFTCKLLLAEYDGSEESEVKKMKRYLKITALMMLLALISAGFLSACGGAKSGDTAATEEGSVSEEISETTEAEADFMEGSADYDVEKGFKKETSDDGSVDYLYFNDFMISMPHNDKWGYETNGNEVTFFLTAAQKGEFGGRLVTIKAYDEDDNSYEQIPVPHQVAGVGKNVNKRFVAIYPSDVQFDFNDEQQTADYKELFDYLKKIKEGAEDSPLQLSDSNPE